MSHRAVALAVTGALVAGAGCAFAVEHPATTAGLVAGSVGLGTCELASDEHASCLVLSGGAGVGLGVITALAMWLGTYEEETPAAGGAGPVGVDPTNLEPAPVFIPPALADAGVPALADAGAPAPDAPAPPPDAAVDAW